MDDEDAHDSMSWVGGKVAHRVVRNLSACHIDKSTVSPMVSFRVAMMIGTRGTASVSAIEENVRRKVTARFE